MFSFKKYLNKVLVVNNPSDDIKRTGSIVIHSGVVPIKEQIKAFKETGVLLHTQRALQYDYDGLINDKGEIDDENFSKVFNQITSIHDITELSELKARAENQFKAQQAIIKQQELQKKKAIEERLKKADEMEKELKEFKKNLKTE